MIVKLIEIRDRNTFIPAMAIQMTTGSSAVGGMTKWLSRRWLLERAGFRDESPSIVVMRLSNQEAHADPYDWRSDARTMPNAHVWIEQHFNEISDGDVIDVEFIFGETDHPKISERLTT